MRRYATLLTRTLLLFALSGAILQGGDFWDEFPVGPLVSVVRPPVVAARPGIGRRGLCRRGGVATWYARTATVHLRWISALPMSQAFARTRLGDGYKRAEGAKRDFAFQQPYHVLAVFSLPPAVLQGTLGGLRLRTSLKIKGQDPIHPRHVRGDGKGANGSIRFSFPKDEADGGHPPVTPSHPFAGALPVKSCQTYPNLPGGAAAHRE